MFLGKEGARQLKKAASVGALGIELGLSVCLGFFGGRWLDGQLGTTPWLKWIGLALGVAAGFRSLFSVTKRTQKELEQKTDEDG